ncbi:MAG: ABC transporter ATP-binding protein [Hyphomonadaceae bacterium]|nr:ABC transporter ATP-binding protein [Hyphomonadaceae bacterium]
MSVLEPTAPLQAQDAVVRFGDLHVLGPVSFDVLAGQCVVLLGPSGCGKSTLLAAFAGLQALSSGQASVQSNNPVPGFVFQSPNLMPWASLLDNVALPLDITGMPKSQARAQAQKTLEMVGLGDFSQAKPRALSGGMAMRGALARALISQPSALLLDEPFAAIDELGRRALNDLVHQIKADRQIAILFVTHSVEEAVYMADTILILCPRPGKIASTIQVPPLRRDPTFYCHQSLPTQLQRPAARCLLSMVSYE